jgi:hydrogenase maturation factor HypF (carbamoyltransferase family)
VYESAMRTYLIIIRGVLRGFGIRGYIYERMVIKGLRGIIEDLEPNEILLCINGSENALNEFIEELKKCTPFAIINDVEVYEFEECLPQEGEDISIIVKSFE